MHPVPTFTCFEQRGGDLRVTLQRIPEQFPNTRRTQLDAILAVRLAREEGW